MKAWAVIGASGLSLLASPALASASGEGGSKAVWIALGVSFLGAFIAIFSSLAAALAARKRAKDPSKKR